MQLPKRKPTRLKNFDYSTPVAYFITVCTQGRRCILSSITNEHTIRLKKSGEIVEKYINEIDNKFSHIKINKFVIMPNHIHLLILVYGDSNNLSSKNTKYRDNIIDAIGWFKYMATKEINENLNSSFTKVFQRSFHDHIIRGERDYQKIWNYIYSNPRLWKKDCFYPENCI